jgi:DNA-binding response OmpR family regulator
MGQAKPIENRTILIVEDEALVRFNLIDFFEDAGFYVFDAESADVAISILEGNNAITVVLTEMPGSMDGLRLAHFIRDRFPPTVLIVTSGAAALEASHLPARGIFVPKPFDPIRLLAQIEILLG